MALKHRQEGRRRMTVMTHCPFCGDRLNADNRRADHFLAEHGPEVIPDV
jgi:hypothetical protein